MAEKTNVTRIDGQAIPPHLVVDSEGKSVNETAIAIPPTPANTEPERTTDPIDFMSLKQARDVLNNAAGGRNPADVLAAAQETRQKRRRKWILF